MVTETYLKCY